MAMFINKICNITQLSVSYAYKKGCRCEDCVKNKALYTKRDINASKRSREWIKNNPERNRALQKKHYEKKWLIAYTEARKKSKDTCYICKCIDNKHKMSNSIRFHIDHCHKTGKIRGLLCGNCNVGLGHFKDDITLLKNAIKYLKKNGDVY